jgi:hypothetical protein
MKLKKLIAIFPLIVCFSLQGQDTVWPIEIKTKEGGEINIYQPQPESMTGNKLDGRTAFSAKAMAGDELIFGVFWFTATLATDRDSRSASLESIQVKEIKLPGIDDTTKIGKLRALLNSEIPKRNITSSLDDIITTIDQEQKLSETVLKNDAPIIYYKDQPTTLVLMDGEPSLKDDSELKMKRVINSAFLIVQNPDDKKYYLYGGQFWYASSSLKDGYQPVSKLPKNIASLDQQLKKDQKENASKEKVSPPALLVSTTPAELIQSKGAADFANISGTNLLYISNSDDDIFKSISDQKYYLLLSGRWYTSPKLDGTWTYIASDKLPEDFAKIPEGSAKDNVLSSVAGTQASKDAIMDAQVPQTAKVDRKTAKCTVKYDGEPKFEKIEGTSMELAMNTTSTVMKADNKYYCVESGVWFVADKATGPWKVSDERPTEVNKIPASSPAYNTQYVYVYDSTPDVVYVGYTPGYMGCYVYGPTVVYGTGYYYNPWYGPYYYPRPVTYGFSMHYNPWTGWSMGFHYSSGFFSLSVYGHPGYWGPHAYRPPYYPPYRGGMYGGRGPTQINHYGDINIDRSNNIYNNRNGVNTNDVKRGQNNGGNRPSTMDQNKSRASTNQNIAGPKNNVYSGKDGSVHQRNDNGSWDQRNGNQWQQNKSTQPSNMDRDYQNRQRSTQQNSNFNQMNRGGNMGGGMRGGGGGRRR